MFFTNTYSALDKSQEMLTFDGDFISLYLLNLVHMMRIDHFAIWTDDIEKMRDFYTTYFDCTSGEKYYNPTKIYTSYFLSFKDSDCRIELMHRPDILDEPSQRGFVKGIAHFDIEVGDEATVDELTERLRKDGYTIASEPRKTGDGYYEAGIIDPEGNYIEISAK